VWVWWRGVPSRLGEGSGEGAALPPREFFFALGFQNGEFWWILCRSFTVELLVYRLR